MKKGITFEEWLKVGFDKGWCGPPVCYTHDGMPTTLEEDHEFEDGNDVCMHVLRLYEDQDMKTAVEENHSPSCWRASNMGLSE